MKTLLARDGFSGRNEVASAKSTLVTHRSTGNDKLLKYSRCNAFQIVRGWEINQACSVAKIMTIY